MLVIRPFKCIRPAGRLAREVASLPYDVINTEEARRLAENNPYSFLRIIRSELELDDTIEPYSDEVYAHARHNFVSALEKGYLFEDQDEALYVYRLKKNGHVQTGVVGCSAVDDYSEGRIKIHEKTKPDKVNDRVRHMLTLGSHCGPVFLTYRQSTEIEDLVKAAVSGEPLYDFTASDGVGHTIWKVNDSVQMASAFGRLPASYVADGHHRAMSAKVCRDEIRKSDPDYSRDHSCNYFLTVLFPHHELKILAYNRIIKSLPVEIDLLISSLGEIFDLEPDANPVPDRPRRFSMYLNSRWYGLSLKSTATLQNDPVGELDVSILQDRVFQPLFGINDPRTDKNIDFVGGIRGTGELERLVESGAAACAFSLYPVAIDQLLKIADEGLLMPPKSTWFEPKLRSGLFVHRFRE